MIKLKANMYVISTKINDQPITHRYFIAFIVAAIFYGLSMLLTMFTPLNSIEKLKEEQLSFIANTKIFESDYKKLEALINQPEKDILEKKINDLKTEIVKVDDEIELITRLLIDPKTMTQLLDNIVKKQSSLTLKSLRSIDHIKQEELGLYQHQIEITVEGGFKEIAKYLHDLEGMPFKVYWKSIDYKSLDIQGAAPKASVVLTIYTLSREGGWLGV